MKNYLDQETQGLVKRDLTTLELCCSPTLPFAPTHSFPQELSDTYPKETQQSALHVLLLLAVLQRAGCPEQPQASRHDAGEGVPCSGGVLHARALHKHRSLGAPGAPGWGCQPGRHCRAFLCSPYCCRADTMEELHCCKCRRSKPATEHAVPAEICQLATGCTN